MVYMAKVILIVITTAYPHLIEMQEFDDIDACVAAAQLIKDEVEYSLTTYCVSKETNDE
jgi:hypothetical protein